MMDLRTPRDSNRARFFSWRHPLAALACASFLFALALVTVACGSSDNNPGFQPPSDTGDANSGGHDGSTPVLGGDGGSPVGLLDGAIFAGDTGASSDVLVIPENFVPTEQGGYALGPSANGNGTDAGLVQNGSAGNCSLVVGVVRDFLSYGLQDGGHPDFERFTGDGVSPGLVESALGTDRKPVYAGICDNSGFANPPCPFGQEFTTQANFDEWYRATQDVNDPYLVYLEFVPNGNVYTFQSTAFFPLDNAGFGNTPGFGHNFSFTTELHLKFTYNGGETFAFSGDDDLWVFIDGKLAIDLGGLHEPATASVSLDTLGLTKGTEYDIELFNAERHSTGSNFRVDTNLAFTNCGTVPPDVPK
ncbi:MAG TPA: fibro-slime domain-containing protein [Polyangiaceae bacterium]|jgi:fibro-slime domain-containing protein